MYLGADSIYAINLKRHKERLDQFNEVIKTLDIKVNIIEGIDNKDVIPLSNDFIKSYLSDTFFDPAGFFSVGVVCCALSHRKAYKAFLDSGDEVGLFLEDDAMPTGFIHDYDFKQLRKELDSIDWGICWYGKWSYKQWVGDQLTDNLYEHPHFVRHNQAAHAYLLNRKSAEWFYKNTEKIKYAADVRLEASPFNQVSPSNAIFLQKKLELWLGNQKVAHQDEFWNSVMDDVPSTKHPEGYRRYMVGVSSEHLPIKSKAVKTFFHRGQEVLGEEYKLYV